MDPKHSKEILAGERFKFGENWKKFLSVLDEERILQAENSLRDFLQVDTLKGLKFIDVGSGSGLFSLAARRLGAEVFSFDYDPESVECTKALKEIYFPGDQAWKIEQGSVLDTGFLGGLGKFDIVYSWGVLHHTGSMWTALNNVSSLVNTKGCLFVAIYNYQPYWTQFYTWLKKAYNKAPKPGKMFIAYSYILEQTTLAFIRDLVFLKPPWRRYSA